MFTYPQSTNWNSHPGAPTGGLLGPTFTLQGGEAIRPLPRVSKHQALRLALGERMCDIETHSPVQVFAPSREWAPAYPPQGSPAPISVPRPSPRRETMADGDKLLGIQAFSKACMSASAAGTAAFTNTTRGGKPTRLGHSLLEVMPLIEHFARSRCADMRFDPYVRFAIDAFQEAGLLEGTAMGPIGQPVRWFGRGYAVLSAASLCNAFVEEIRRRGRQVSTGREMQRHEDAHAARANGLRSYLADVGKRHADCDVKRFELCMRRTLTLNDREEYNFMLEASVRFLRSVKEQFGQAIVADIHKIDRGATSPYLLHMLLALDGPSKQELAAMDQILEELWLGQTHGLGYLIDCNAVDEFMYRGSGMLARQNESIASQLDKAATFLADTDRVIRVGHEGTRDGLIVGAVSGRHPLQPIR